MARRATIPPDGQAIAPTMRAMNMVGPLVCPILVGRDDLLALAERRLGAGGRRPGPRPVPRRRGRDRQDAPPGIDRAPRGGARVPRRPGRHVPGRSRGPGRRVPRARAGDAPDAGPRRDRRAGGVAPGRARRLGDGTPEGDAHRRRRLLTLDIADDLAAVAADGPTLLCPRGPPPGGRPDARDRRQPRPAGAGRAPPRRWPRTAATSSIPGSRCASGAPACSRSGRPRRRACARLDLDETATMASVLLASGEPAPRDIAVAIHDRTDGIPLHVEELSALLGASGTGATWRRPRRTCPTRWRRRSWAGSGCARRRPSRLPGSGR